MRRPRRRLERRQRRRQHETLRASPTQVSAVPPPRYPQVGKTVEGDEIAKRQRITGRVVPRYLWERKTMEGTTPPPRALGVFRHPGTIRRCCSRPLLRRGRRALRIKGQIALVLETPRGRYGPIRQAAPWAWASTRDLPRTYKAAQCSERNGYSAGKTTEAREGKERK